MRQLYTLRIYLANGKTWTQTGVAYASIAEVKAVWDKIGSHLPEDARGQAIPREMTQ